MRAFYWWYLILTGAILSPAMSIIPFQENNSSAEFTTVELVPTCDRTQDSLALVAFYAATNGPIWTQKWNLNNPMGTWYGLQFTAEGCVRSIKLPNNQLQGTLPQEIGNLVFLEELWLQINFLIGPIPDTLTSCNLLRDLRLFNNSLSGTLPDLGQWDSLRFLNLARNTIRGSVPESIGELDSLNYLNLGSNRLDDTLPQGLGDLTELTLLDLSDNRFVGPLPIGLGNLTKLKSLFLFTNQLTGPLPTGIQDMADLEMLWVYSNKLSGAVPDLNGLPLVSLRLEFNKFEDLPDLTGLNKLGVAFPNGLTAQYNRLTFEDIIPNLVLTTALFEFVPQDSVGEADTVYLFEGDNFIWDLGIDPGVPDNNYKFFRNDTVIRFQNNGDLLVPDLKKRNSGVYMAEITNFNVPELTLWTRPRILVVQDTTNCGKPAAGIACNQAPLLCDVRVLDDYCGTLPDSINLTTPRPLCTMGIPENAHWLSFVASDSTMTIRVIPSSCEGVINNNTRVAGMQGAILDGCIFNQATALACSGDCSEDPFILASDQFVPGAVYYLVIDGCSADVCDYRLELLTGNAKFELPDPDSLFGPEIVCFGEMNRYFIVDTSAFTDVYLWTTSGGDTMVTTRPFLDYSAEFPGAFELCVSALNDCDTSLVYCREFQMTEQFRADTIGTFCNADKQGYRAIMTLAGGIPPYVLIEGEGTINAGSNRFLSDTLENDTTYHFVFQDSIGCTLDTSIYYNCFCESDAGAMDSTMQVLCIGDTAVAMLIGGHFLDADDDSLFVIHDRGDDELGNILLINKTGYFVFDPSKMDPGTVYYMSMLVATSNGFNGIKFNDPCLSVAPGQAVAFYEEAVADAGDPVLFCGLEGQLDAQLPYGSGEWQICQGPGQVLVESPGEPDSRVQVSEAGNYTFCWNVTVGSCTASDTVSVFFNESPELRIGGDTVFCQSSTAELVAEGNFISFRWSTGENTRVINVTGHGTYCVTATDEANCDVSTCVTLELIPKPTPVIEGPSAVCDNGFGDLTVTEAFDSYRWNTGDQTRTVTIQGPGVYCVTVTGDHGCEGSRCFPVGLLFNGTSNISETICYGETYTNGTISASASGSYQFTLEGASANGCDSMVNLELLVLDSIRLRDTIIQPDLGNNTGVISIQVGGGMPPYEVKWSNGQTGNTIVGLAAGLYTAVITDVKGCLGIFVLRVPTGTATKDFEKEIGEWRVIPNPAEEGRAWNVRWVARNAGDVVLNLYDITGRTVWSDKWTYPSGESTRQIQAFVAPGIYWLEWTGKGGLRSALPVVVH